MSEDDSITINAEGLKESAGKVSRFFKQKKVLASIFVIAFLAFLIIGSSIRLENVPLLKDSTTGQYIPAALDPFYFLRIAETIVSPGGLPKYDSFRQPFDVPFTNEILPQVLVFTYKLVSVFNHEVSLQYIDVIYPVIFFALGLIAFFFLTYALTSSKLAALLGSIFLAVIPSYLYRTMAGFADHEPIGIFAFFLVLLSYTYAMRTLDKDERDKKSFLKIISYGILTGLLSSLTIASWGGAANFIFMIIPLSFGIFWVVKSQKVEREMNHEKQFKRYIWFYLAWFLASIISPMIYGFDILTSISRVTLASTSILSGAVFLFVIMDYLFITNKFGLLHKISEKYRVLWSSLATGIVGIILMTILGHNILSIISDLYFRLFNPFAAGRVGLTVAENRQPYLDEWIAQTGKIFFWLFLGGVITLGINFSSAIKHNKDKFIFSLLWIFFILGLLFSRTSPTSILNGTSFISQLFYIGSILLLIIYSIKIYFNDKIEISPEMLIMFSWTVFMLIAARSAVRTFFLISPFACFAYGLLVVNLIKYVKKSKDDLLRMILVIMLIAVVVLSFFSFNNMITASKAQAKSTGPSANYQWQNAMQWVRDNTPANSIFLHWWDYGYWVEYLGQRPTLADGGHFQGAFRNHLIGRYVLTTPYPETALSFMKTNNASYLLIDPTDLGKYGAYSIIGSDSSGKDRYSQIPVLLLDSSRVQETADSQIRLYTGGTYIDEDIIYPGEDGQEVFLPAEKAGLAAIGIDVSKNNSLKGVFGIYIYNSKQVTIPLRYVYFQDRLVDFEGGLDATVRIISSGSTGSQQQLQLDKMGAVIYFSPKVSKSLFAQLYLMNDPLNEYPTIKLAHSEQDGVVQSLNSQGADVGEFIYFQGFRGPIKIWDTRTIPQNIVTSEEFLRTEGEYAEFDNLTFTT